MDYAEITVDPKFHRHLIGKGGVNSEYSVTAWFIHLWTVQETLFKRCIY